MHRICAPLQVREGGREEGGGGGSGGVKGWMEGWEGREVGGEGFR